MNSTVAAMNKYLGVHQEETETVGKTIDSLEEYFKLTNLEKEEVHETKELTTIVNNYNRQEPNKNIVTIGPCGDKIYLTA